MAVDFPAGLLQFGIVGTDGSGAGAADAELVQQPGAVGLAQVSQVVADDGAGGVIGAALVFLQVLDALAGGEDTQARLAAAHQLGQQRLQAGGAQLTGHRAGRVLQRLHAVQHQQGAAGGHRLGQRLPLSQGERAGLCSTANQPRAALKKLSSEAWRSSLVPWLKKLQPYTRCAPRQPSTLRRSSQRLTSAVLPTPPGRPVPPPGCAQRRPRRHPAA